jgi:hypothetical protein
MSALGQKQTCAVQDRMSALPPESGHHGGLPDIKNGSGDAGRYSRSFGMSASVASPPYGEGNAYCVTAAIARN